MIGPKEVAKIVHCGLSRLHPLWGALSFNNVEKKATREGGLFCFCACAQRLLLHLFSDTTMAVCLHTSFCKNYLTIHAMRLKERSRNSGNFSHAWCIKRDVAT